MKKPELLLPASCPEVLRTAIMYGADAVYIGGELYGLRAKAKNFTNEDMANSIAYAHEHGKKVYVTANITAHNRDLDGIKAYFGELTFTPAGGFDKGRLPSTDLLFGQKITLPSINTR